MKVAVLGAGKFGTAISQVLSASVDDVFIFSRNENTIQSINQNGQNTVYYPYFKLNKNIKAYSFKDKDELKLVDIVFFAVPSGEIKTVANLFEEQIAGKLVIMGEKGLESDTYFTASQILKRECPKAIINSLSGPTFADELLRGNYSAATVGFVNEEAKAKIKQILKNSNLLLDYSQDVEGVEIAGVLKNVYAIAIGIFDSYYANSNSHYMFQNLCYKEMTHYLGSMSRDNGLPTKFCAFGDLLLTSNVDKSRNRTLGLMIGKELITQDGVNSAVTFEGLKSVRGMDIIAKKNGINAPIIEFVTEVIEKKERHLEQKIHKLLFNNELSDS